VAGLAIVEVVATLNLWPDVDGAAVADSVDDDDGSVGVLLDGLHSCWW
jgi:hypothetical protein